MHIYSLCSKDGETKIPQSFYKCLTLIKDIIYEIVEIPAAICTLRILWRSRMYCGTNGLSFIEQPIIAATFLLPLITLPRNTMYVT